MLYGHGKRHTDRPMKTPQLFGKKQYSIIAGVALLYITMTVLVSKFYVTVQYIPYFVDTINWFQLLLSVVLTLTIGTLLGLNVALLCLIYQEYKHNKTCSTSGLGTTASVTSIGAVGGVATGVCSACVASIFPALFGLFGITLSWGALPFQGLEIQAGIVALLTTNGYYLRKKLVKGGVYD